MGAVLTESAGSFYTWSTFPGTWSQAMRPWSQTAPYTSALAIDEAMSFADARGQAWTALLGLAEAWGFAEAYANAPAQDLRETVSVGEALGATSQWVRAFAEAVALVEARVGDFAKPLSEAFTAADADPARELAKNIQELVQLAEQVDRANIFVRDLAETLGVADAIGKNQAKALTELFRLLDEYTRRANATISDLKISTADLSDTDFQNLLTFGGMVGYTDWKPFIAGDYQFQKAALRYIVRALSADRPRLKTMTIVADMPDIHDRGTATLAAGGWTSVAFNRTFTSTQGLEVTLQLKAGTVIGTPEIDPAGTTTTGFRARINAGTSGIVAGTISWAALGR